MIPPRTTRGPYVRPMGAWWRRNPFFLSYMLRESTALAVAAYALVLTVGVVRLAQGELAWNGWLQALKSPGSLWFHGLLILGMAFHAQSWFAIMPKTMPMMAIGGRRVAASTITRAGWGLSLVVTAALVGWIWWR